MLCEGAVLGSQITIPAQKMLSFEAVRMMSEDFESLLFIYIDPRCPIFGIFIYIYHKSNPDVGTYSVHGAYADVC